MQSLEVISVNIWDILISLLNLLLIFIIFKRFLYKPVRKFLDKRKAAIDSDYDVADKAKSDALAEKQAYESKMKNAQNEADEMIKSAASTADRRSAKIIDDAKIKADGILRQAQSEIELEKKKAADDIKREIADVSALLTEKMLEREINKDDHREFIDSFIEGIGEKTMAQVINEYADALFDLSEEAGIKKEISAALDTVLNVVDENPEYLDFLSSPNIPKSERIAAIEQAFSGEHEYIISFLSLLCEKGRICEIRECISEFKQLCDAADKISVAQVTSAVELSESQKAALTAKLQKLCGNRVVLDCKTDKSLMGGMVVAIDGKVIDGSIKHQLHQLKEVMYK